MMIAQVNDILNSLYTSNGYTFSYYGNKLITENYQSPMVSKNWNVELNIQF